MSTIDKSTSKHTATVCKMLDAQFAHAADNDDADAFGRVARRAARFANTLTAEGRYHDAAYCRELSAEADRRRYALQREDEEGDQLAGPVVAVLGPIERAENDPARADRAASYAATSADAILYGAPGVI